MHLALREASLLFLFDIRGCQEASRSGRVAHLALACRGRETFVAELYAREKLSRPFIKGFQFHSFASHHHATARKLAEELAEMARMTLYLRQLPASPQPNSDFRESGA